jgi:hypothetical protein
MITQIEFNQLERQGISYFKQLAERLDDNDYWTILRAMWIDKGICNDEWAELFFKSGRKREHKIMKSSDRQALKKLPKQFKIYRVCTEKADENKWNWTTSKEFAEKYLQRHGKYIAEKIINKSDVFAYFNSRQENEIILKV